MEKRYKSLSSLTEPLGEFEDEPSLVDSLKRSRTISSLTEPVMDYKKPLTKKQRPREQITPKEYIEGTWRYLQSMGTRGEHVDKEILKTILETMQLKSIKKACEEDELLKMKYNAIHNKIRDLTENWNESKRGGKRSRRFTKKSNKRKSNKKNNFDVKSFRKKCIYKI